jgi:wyosine [tRNA(Phe)-imidazoG37] synthetase (radical SAM superfamily)
MTSMIAFGPVPSRRLGQSLGVNNIPPKMCTYSCVYCQLGRTANIRSDPEYLYDPDDILQKVKEKIEKVEKTGKNIDYLTFVPDGEPTLDKNLGKEIDLLKQTSIKVAVITNSSLLWREEVRKRVAKADWVSVKVDAVTENVWRKINRPHKDLECDTVLQGVITFSRMYTGELTTETMLVEGLNDSNEELEAVADFVAGLHPAKSYISIPIRPPAEPWATPASEQGITKAYQLFTEKSLRVECLTGYEGNAFAFTGDVKEDILSITSVHPMREESVTHFLEKAGAGWDAIEKLLCEGSLVEVMYRDKKFYIRKLPV